MESGEASVAGDSEALYRLRSLFRLPPPHARNALPPAS